MGCLTSTRTIALGLTVVILCNGCAASEPWSLALPQPALRPASDIYAITSYERAAATIAAAFERDFGFGSFPVTLHFYPGRDAFEAALLQSGYDPSLARDTARTMSAVGGHRQVLLNESMLLPLSWPGRVGLLAHELTHSLQYEWGGGVRGASDQWLREGFADWITARILARLGATTIERVREQKREEVRTLDRSRIPRLDAMATFPEWVEANSRFEGAPYAHALLAVDFLIDRHGTAAVVRYFELFARSGDRRENFRAAFGEDLSAFEEALLGYVLPRRR